ncbi:hypothetical protein FBZ96_108143 [Bradyrhizobium stylosanthis]|uniref:Uncharacterized protein n=1 Tax=Bradyrhizobium stylosanthis TaxID=1803665 RepID=A0A560DBI8_9BRAD|nr:hypothetical protein FBZ96_108143 [Bradyrhizobium stylosanthis]
MMRVLKLDTSQNKAVMAGLVPAIHALPHGTENVDARDKPGHDEDRLTP